MRSDQHPEVPLTRGLRKSQTHRDGKEMGEGGAGTGRGGGEAGRGPNGDRVCLGRWERPGDRQCLWSHTSTYLEPRNCTLRNG